jgi:hypothetical protein
VWGWVCVRGVFQPTPSESSRSTNGRAHSGEGQVLSGGRSVRARVCGNRASHIPPRPPHFVDAMCQGRHAPVFLRRAVPPSLRSGAVLLLPSLAAPSLVRSLSLSAVRVPLRFCGGSSSSGHSRLVGHSVRRRQRITTRCGSQSADDPSSPIRRDGCQASIVPPASRAVNPAGALGVEDGVAAQSRQRLQQPEPLQSQHHRPAARDARCGTLARGAGRR